MNTEFLQSEAWLRLQEATGKETLPFVEEGFSAHGIIHTLPLAGQYLYVPRGPQTNITYHISNIKKSLERLVTLAKEKKVKWVRVEPETEELLEEIKKAVPYKVVRAPHDMQPREVFKIDTTLSEEELLARMKSKTRYNIRLAEKRGVKVFQTREANHITTFLDLITATSGRKGISAHPRSYYEKFFQILPEDMCQLFVAEYQGVVVAANMVIFFGQTATYLHGGSGDAHRDVMAPYLLQWEQIKTAKAMGCTTYDFGGVKTTKSQQKSKSDWGGITKFKTGFSPETTPTLYPGTYDVILDTTGYFLYNVLRPLQAFKKSIIG